MRKSVVLVIASCGDAQVAVDLGFQIAGEA